MLQGGKLKFQAHFLSKCHMPLQMYSLGQGQNKRRPEIMLNELKRMSGHAEYWRPFLRRKHMLPS